MVVVDSQYPDTAPACIDGLKQKSPHAIDLLINTHHHGDHTAGNKAFRAAAKSIVAHESSALWQKKAAEQAKTEADRPAGASIANWITVLETVPKQHSDDTIYIFGHGKAEFGVTGRKAELAKFRDYLTAALDHTWKQTAAGKTRRTSSRFKRCPASTSTRRRRRPSSRSAAS